LLACGALTLWLWNAYATRGSGRLEIWFLNVGQGDAAVLRTPAGKTLVVDAGSSEANGADAGRRVLVPFLRSQGLGRIDSLILTSRRGEQSGGAVTLLRQVEVGTLIDTGQPPGPRLQTAILQAALDRHVPCKAAHAGDTLECGDGVTLRFLTPSRERAPAGIGNTESRNTNPADTGLVFRVEYGRTALLFMNGADNVVEANLIRSRQPLACDVLKVARQGNADATTVGLLAAARPRFAVISVSAHNLFHDPSLDVIARLQNVGARIYRTDQSGAIACISDGVTFRLTPTLPAQP
jgi:competence protein ComEC